MNKFQDLNSAWVCLPCSLSKGLLKRDFLGIYLITFLESVISETQNLWALSFFSKRSKFQIDLKNGPKIEKKFFFFCDNCIWIAIIKLFLWRTRYISSPANVLTSSPKIFPVNKGDLFQLIFLWQWLVNMIMVLRCWFQECFARFTMLLAEGFSETRVFRHLANHFSEVRNLGNTKAVRVIFFLRMVKI